MLGRGPGTEILGVLKCKENLHSENRKITFFLIDPVEAWQGTWSDLGEKVENAGQVFVNYVVKDALQPGFFRLNSKMLRSDVVTLVYFLSEVYKRRSEMGSVYDFCKQLHDDAKILIIDNNTDIFYKDFVGTLEEMGFSESWRCEENYVLSRDEDKKILEPYITKLDFSPKLTAQSIRLVFSKQQNVSDDDLPF